MFTRGFISSSNTAISLNSFAVNTLDDGSDQNFGSFYLQATNSVRLTEVEFSQFSYSTSWTFPSDLSVGDIAIVIDYKWTYAGGLPMFAEVIPTGFTNIFSTNQASQYQKTRLIVSYKSIVSGDIGSTVNGMTNDSGGRSTKMLLVFEPNSSATYSTGDIFSISSGNMQATNTTVSYPSGEPIIIVGAKTARNTSLGGSLCTLNTTSGSFTNTLLQENDNFYNLRTSYYLDIPSYTVDILAIGGGGSGGCVYSGTDTAGGGGAGGGKTYKQNVSIKPNITYTITVGAGGAGVAQNQAVMGSQGGTSQVTGSDITTITAIGGGGGATGFQGGSGPNFTYNGGVYTDWNGDGGGAGGAGGYNPPNPFAGNTGNATYYIGAGGDGEYRSGGGGAGVNDGLDSIELYGAAGGAGLENSITGTATYYAGGGGGSGLRGRGSGGLGGGGAGGRTDRLTIASGTDGLGGGGGGGVNAYWVTATSGDGGDGVVIIRVLTSKYSGTTTGSPTVSTDGSYTVLTWTSSGSYTA